MTHPSSTNKALALRRLATCMALAAPAVLLAVHTPSSAADGAPGSTFPSPEAAAQALYRAVQRHDDGSLAAILGARIVHASGQDKSAERRDQDRFAERYREMHRLVEEEGVTVLYIGAENWPFPLPLVGTDAGWRFDARRGVEEIDFRRIGENELNAMATCHALVQGQAGRYVLEPAGSVDKLRVGQSLVAASGPGAKFRGYVFQRVADDRAEVGCLAYPAVYGSTGVMTFLVDQDSAYAKDLAAETPRPTKPPTVIRIDETWRAEE